MCGHTIAQILAAQGVGKHGEAVDQREVETHVGRDAEGGTVAEADVAVQAQLQLVHVATDGVGGRQGNHADLVEQVIVAAGFGLGAAAQVFALDAESGRREFVDVIAACQVQDAPVVVGAMLVQVVERLVVAGVAILQAHVVVHGVVAQHEAALPTGIQVEIGERLLLGVPVEGCTGSIGIGSIKIKIVILAPTAIMVVDVDMALGAQGEGTVADAAAVVHGQGVVVVLLLQAVLVNADNLAGVLAVPSAVVVEPHAQFLALLVNEAISEIHAEVGLGATAQVQITALIAEVMGRAVAVRQQGGNRGGDIDGRSEVTVSQLGLLARRSGSLDLGELVFLNRLLLERCDVLLEGDFLVQVGFILGHCPVQGECGQQHANIYLLHNYTMMCDAVV